MKKFSIIFAVLFTVLFTAHCTSPSQTPDRPWESLDNKTPVNPSDGVVPNYPKLSEPTPPSDSGDKRIALVLGGAGVASFATIGLLKKLHEEKIKIDVIISTGWPTLFALARAFLPTLHELEWFGMRLTEKDFFRVGLFDSEKDFASHDKLGKLFESAFGKREIQDGKIPVVISAANVEFGEPEIFDHGDWRDPLLKTMSVPGIFRPYPSSADRQSISSLQGLDVEEAKRRGYNMVVAFYMYDDYLHYIAKGKKDADALFRKLYQAQLRKSLGTQLRLANVRGAVELFKVPNDFSAKRAAIIAGYQEGDKIVKMIREVMSQ